MERGNSRVDACSANCLTVPAEPTASESPIAAGEAAHMTLALGSDHTGTHHHR